MTLLHKMGSKDERHFTFNICFRLPGIPIFGLFLVGIPASRD